MKVHKEESIEEKVAKLDFVIKEKKGKFNMVQFEYELKLLSCN